MMLTKIENLTVEIKKTIKAPIKAVYAAWTEPDQMSKWMGCDQVRNVRAVQDFRVGGDYQIEMTKADTGKELIVSGQFKEIVPNKRVVYSWTSNFEDCPVENTLVAVEFVEVGNTTELILVHSKFPNEDAAQKHSQGWQGSIDKMVQILSQ
jgi:uncharacterized protein YndB with AHSA1/START domain